MSWLGRSALSPPKLIFPPVSIPPAPNQPSQMYSGVPSKAINLTYAASLHCSPQERSSWECPPINLPPSRPPSPLDSRQLGG